MLHQPSDADKESGDATPDYPESAAEALGVRLPDGAARGAPAADRRAETLEGFFDWLGPARSAALYFVCSDMWKPYLKVVAERAQQAVHVLGRFHIMSHFSKAIDEVRAAEVRKLAAAGKAPVLKHSRWLLLKRPEHLTDAQEDRLADLVRRNLRTVRAYLLKEDFQRLWGNVSPYWAGRFEASTLARAMGPCYTPHDSSVDLVPLLRGI